MTWRAYLARTMDGATGRALVVTGGSVTITLNGIEEIRVECSRASLAGVERHWWSPGSGAVLVTWEGDEGEVPIAAGRIDAPVGEDRAHKTITITASGPGAILADRTVLDRDYSPGEEDAAKTSTIYWSGVSLGSMVGRIVQAACAKRNGWLPIVVPPVQYTSHERTYEGWNLGNNNAWKRIQELTEVIGGPDVMFRPRWVDSDHTAFEWALATGTEDQPGIAQQGPILWDSTSHDSPVESITVTSTAALAHRVYATGSGEGAGIALAIADAPLPEWMPLVEAVIADSDADHDPLLREKAAAALVTQPLDQLDMQVSSRGQGAFGTWHVGDLVDVQVEGWLHVPDGVHQARLIAATFDLGSEVATVKCQPEQWGDDLSW